MKAPGALRLRALGVARSLTALVLAQMAPSGSWAQATGDAAAQPAAKAGAGPKTEEQKVLYALGATLARDLGVFHLTAAEVRFVSMGLKDAVAGGPLQVDLKEYGPRLNELAASRSRARAEGEKRKAKGFVERAAAEKGTEKTASGLLYREIAPGTGASPAKTDTVKVHYHGTLVDGTVFDSSVSRGQPVDFPLDQVIPCWTEGLQKMKAGGKARLVCPSEIAYGDQGRPPAIPGGATLVFEVELLEVLKK